MTEDTSPAVTDEAVDASLEAVARYWKGSRSPLQQYPSRPLTRVMLEAAAPLIAAPRLTGGQCDRLHQMVAEHGNAVSAVERALMMTAPLDDADREIIAAGWAALKVLAGDEEEVSP